MLYSQANNRNELLLLPNCRVSLCLRFAGQTKKENLESATGSNSFHQSARLSTILRLFGLWSILDPDVSRSLATVGRECDHSNHESV